MRKMIARDAQTVKNDIIETSKYLGVSITDGAKGAVVGYMNKYFGGDNNRYLVCSWLFDKKEPLKSKFLNDSQWYAIMSWIAPYKNDDEPHWSVDDCFPAEAMLVLTEALRWFNSAGSSVRNNFANCMPGEVLLSAVDIPGSYITAIADENGNSLHVDGVEFPGSLTDGIQFPNSTIDGVEFQDKAKYKDEKKNIFNRKPTKKSNLF